MIKRWVGGILMVLGLCLGSVALFSGPASADGGYGSSPSSSVVPASTTSTTDPCLIGNGTTGTTNPSCYGATKPASSSPANSTAAATTAGTAASSGLAFTGTDVIGTVILGSALIGGGLVVVRLSRRRSTN